MATGLYVNGRGDLDDLFMARVNAARAGVGYVVGGADIANRFEKIGNGTPIAATGFQYAGTDLASLFRNKVQALPYSFTMVAGTNGSIYGYRYGAFGSMTPNVYPGGWSFEIGDQFNVPAINGFNLAIQVNGLAQNHFQYVQINGYTFYSNVGIKRFLNTGGFSHWTWTEYGYIASGSTYPFTVQP